jgi:flavin-dependent dehydrogenase
MGIARDGSLKDSFTRGMELLGKYTLFAEGARGSLSKQLIAKFSLDANSEPPKFGIGLKEVWEIDPAKHQKGLVQHTLGWPLNNTTGGGSFLYHYDDNKVAVGFVVHLNYDDPYLSPFDEFQRFKTHPRSAPCSKAASGLWRARDHRGRLSIGAASEFPGRRADRLRSRLRQRAAHQGRAQRDGQRHARRRTRHSARRRPRQ